MRRGLEASGHVVSPLSGPFSAGGDGDNGGTGHASPVDIAETATETEEATPSADAAETQPRPGPPRNEATDSAGRHDGSNYDNLSPEGQEAHDTMNCAKIPGKKKGSCNELHRKCRESGATAVSSLGEELTCRTSPRDGQLRWLAEGE